MLRKVFRFYIWKCTCCHFSKICLAMIQLQFEIKQIQSCFNGFQISLNNFRNTSVAKEKEQETYSSEIFGDHTYLFAITERFKQFVCVVTPLL